MPHDHYSQFVLAVFLGFGLILAAVANLTLRSAGFGRRAIASAMAGGAAVILCRAYERDVELLAPLAASLAAILALALAFASSLPGWLAERARRPLAVWRGCCLLGVAIIALAAARFEVRDQVAIDRGMTELETLDDLDQILGATQYRPENAGLATDLGAPVETWAPVNSRSEEEQLRIEDAFFRDRWNRDHVIRTGVADDRANCYGWIFTGGRHWVPAASATQILGQNGYREVDAPAPGDLVAYRRRGTIHHLAVVRYTAEKRPPLVEGKWGFNGVYLHAADHSPFGREYAYFRSPRTGHLLNGLRMDEPPIEDRTE